MDMPLRFPNPMGHGQDEGGACENTVPFPLFPLLIKTFHASIGGSGGHSLHPSTKLPDELEDQRPHFRHHALRGHNAISASRQEELLHLTATNISSSLVGGLADCRR